MAGLTYDQIGRILGVTPARVQQLEARALEKMRKGLAKAGVKAEDVKEIRTKETGDTFKLAE